MADEKTYRHSVTGLTGIYPDDLAAAFADVLTPIDATPVAPAPVEASFEAAAEAPDPSIAKAK